MTRPPPAIDFSLLPAPPPPGWIQFFDGYFPALAAGTYNIGLTHTVTGPTSPSYSGSQTFVVQAPEFTIDATIVQAAFPPPDGSDRYEQSIPFVVLTDPALPWERALAPNGTVASESNPLPWMALVVLAEKEIVFPSGATNPLTTRTVAKLVSPDPTVLKPQFPSGWIASEMLESQCQTITVSGAAFAATMPQKDELPFLAHVRAVNSPTEGQHLLSVLLGNRLPLAQPHAAIRWHAHLVSLEGFAAYLGPNATPIPKKPDSTPQDVMLVSLHGWTFVSLPETGFDFAHLAKGLVASGSPPGTPSLGLPVPAERISSLPAPVARRLQEGYAPLTFIAHSGEQSFAWYRGPFTPTVPQPLPNVGAPPVPPAEAASADALMIYLAEAGLFDLSYAAAWNIGRSLALADARFAQAVHALRLSANNGLGTVAQRLALSHFGGETDASVLLARGASRQRFAERVTGGLGARWHATLGAVRDGGLGRPPRWRRRTMHRGEPPAAPRLRAVLGHPGVPAAIADRIAEQIAPVARWLERAMLLENVPFSHLVPDPRMLPVESIRFFYVDPCWLEAFTAGAMSLAIHGSADVEIQAALRSYLVPRSNVTGITGMLIRSQMIKDIPGLRVTATTGGAQLTLLRDDLPAPSVRLTLFQGVPDTVAIAQPYRGLLFGLESSAVAPRAVTGGAIGAQIAGLAPIPAPLRTPASGATGGVIDVATLTKSLATATGASGYSPASVIHWNGTALPTAFVAPGRLTATVSAALLASVGTAEVTVVDGGVTSNGVAFAVERALSLDALSPTMAIAGADAFTLTAEGRGFDPSAVLQWNGNARPTRAVGSTLLLAQVPAALVAAPGTATITVLSGGVTTNAIALPIVSGEPEIDSISPTTASTGASGFTLTITGSGFARGTLARWNGSPLVTTFVDSGHLTALVPGTLLAKAGAVPVVTVFSAATSNTATFTIVQAGGAPVIGSMSPTVAIVGAAAFTLAIDGANFAHDAVVRWGTAALSTTFDDSGRVTASVTELLKAGPVKVTVTQTSGTSNAVEFTLLPAKTPIIGLLVPRSAAAGSATITLSVHGGFGAGDFALQFVQTPELQSFIPRREGIS